MDMLILSGLAIGFYAAVSWRRDHRDFGVVQFLLGAFVAGGLNMALQDALGLAAFVAMAERSWVALPWWVGGGFAAIGYGVAWRARATDERECCVLIVSGVGPLGRTFMVRTFDQYEQAEQGAIDLVKFQYGVEVGTVGDAISELRRRGFDTVTARTKVLTGRLGVDAW